MSSEAITQNDLREILSRTVGSIPSEYKKLLWTNPNPSADFAPQTKLFDLSEYDEVEIVATFLGDTNASYSTRCAVGAGSNLAYQILNTATATNASTFINGVAREFTVSTSGITFGNGQMTYNGGAYTNWQSRAIPYKIYGIKYERVAPPQVDASDYVIEQGTSGIWTYRKWDSGIAECWGRYTFSVTATEMNFWVSFPFTFINADTVVNCTAKDIGYGSANTAQTNVGVSEVQTSQVKFVSKGPFSGYSQTIQIFAIGKWK